MIQTNEELFQNGKTTVTHTSIHVLRVFPSPTSYPIGSMYGLFIYIRWKMATFKGKCRFLVGIHIPYMDSLGMVIPRNPRLPPCFYRQKIRGPGPVITRCHQAWDGCLGILPWRNCLGFYITKGQGVMMKHYHPLLLERINIFFVFAALFFCCWCLGSCVCFNLGGDLVVPKSCFCVPPPPSINHQNQPLQTKVRLKDGDLCQLCLQATASQRRRYWQAAESVNHGYHSVSGGGPEFCGVNEVESGGENGVEKHTKYGLFLEQHGWVVDIITYQLYWNEDVFVGQKIGIVIQNFQKGLERAIVGHISISGTSWDFTMLSWNSKIEVWKMNVLFTTEIVFWVPC